MKTTLELPDKLMRQIKVRAAKSGRKLKDLVAELLEKGLAATGPVAPAKRPAIKTDPKTGLPYIECFGDAPGANMTAEEIIALEQQTLFEEDMERLGVPLR